MSQENDRKYIARNRKARFNFEIRDTIETGIELRGPEVKSLREGKLNISDAYAVVENGEVILKNLHISPYKMAQEALDPLRPRRLLLHKREIRKLKAQTEQKGMALVPVAIYFFKNLVKIELGLGLGRKKYDKRDAISKAEADRKIKQAKEKNY